MLINLWRVSSMRVLIERSNRKGVRYYEDSKGVIISKQCSKCDVVKVLGEFGRNKGKLGDRYSQCRSCKRIIIREYQQDNADKINAYQRRRNQTNPEKI